MAARRGQRSKAKRSALRFKQMKGDQRRQRRHARNVRLHWGAAWPWAEDTGKSPVVSFFGKKNPTLSNHHVVTSTTDGRRLDYKGGKYLSVEHAYMAKQALHFGHAVLAGIWTRGSGIHQIRGRRFDAANPKNIKSWATLVLGPMKHQRPDLKASWDAKKADLMFALNWAKYRQFSQARAVLFATGRAFLVEANERDNFWGTGTRLSEAELQKGPTAGPRAWGRNQMGMILMKIRRCLVLWYNRHKEVKERAIRYAILRQQRAERRKPARGPKTQAPPGEYEVMHHFQLMTCPALLKRMHEGNRMRKAIKEMTA